MPMRLSASGIYTYIPSHVPAIDMLGKRIGRLVIIARMPSSDGAIWRWRCDCGAEGETLGQSLRQEARRPRKVKVACRDCVKSDLAALRMGRPRRNKKPKRQEHWHQATARRLSTRDANKVCKRCFGMAHRRPKRGCPKCGEGYREECA